MKILIHTDGAENEEGGEASFSDFSNEGKDSFLSLVGII